MKSFQPAAQATISIDVTASPQRIQYSTDPVPQQVRIFNSGTATVWVTYGDVNCNASMTTSLPLPSGAVEVFTYTGGYVSAIAAAATGKVYISPGAGV